MFNREEFPDIHIGILVKRGHRKDTGQFIVYPKQTVISLACSESDLEWTLIHETIHYVIEKLFCQNRKVRREMQLGFDRIDQGDSIIKWMFKTKFPDYPFHVVDLDKGKVIFDG